MELQEILDAILAAVERCGCRLVRRNGRLGLVAARRMHPPGLYDLLEAYCEPLLAVVPAADGTERTTGADCTVAVGKGRNTTYMHALKDPSSLEFRDLADRVFAQGGA